MYAIKMLYKPHGTIFNIKRPKLNMLKYFTIVAMLLFRVFYEHTISVLKMTAYLIFMSIPYLK